MDAIARDLRFALRSLFKQGAFTAVVVATLAIGIGANTAIFSVVNAALLRPLPFSEPDRLFLIWGDEPASGFPRLPLSLPNFTDVRARTNSFEGMAAWTSFTDSRLSLTDAGEPEKVQYAVVSANLFSLLGVAPALGRTFHPEEDRFDAARGVILSHALWERRFGGRRTVDGASVTLDGTTYNVLGVLPPRFGFVSYPREPDVWLPFGLDPLRGREYARGAAALGVVARLAPSATAEQARLELERVAAQLADEYPRFNRGWTLRLVSLRDQVVGDVRPSLLIMLGAVGLVLLIGCANVANLLLARGASRQREIAIRAALGASRRRLAVQLLAESLVLAVAGGGLGLLAAVWLVELPAVLPLGAADVFVPYRVPRDQVSIDGTVLAFTFGVSLVTGVLFGLLPALKGSRPALHESLKTGGRASADAGRSRMRGALVVAEIAIALTLVIGAGLLTRSFARLQQVDPGFRADGVLMVDVNLPAYRYDDARAGRFFETVLSRVRALPGVREASAAEQVPLTGLTQESDFRIGGAPPPGDGVVQQAAYTSITPDYFAAMSIRLVRGRPLLDADDARAPRVVVINESMARRFWPGEDPIGKRISLGVEALRFDRPNAPPRFDYEGAAREIVGVAADVRQNALTEPARPAMYLPLAQRPVRDLTLAIRTECANAGRACDLLHLVGSVRAEVRAFDPDQPISAVTTMSDIAALAVRDPRERTALLATFALVALVLAAVGVYGVIAYSVSERTHEIGVRVALGAARTDVVRLVVGQALALAGYGVAAGLAGALALSTVLGSLLYGVATTDPMTYVAAPAVLVAVTLAASWLPAKRAARVDPVEALRER